MSKGQGNGGGWPSQTGNPSGGGRTNGPSGGGKGKQLNNWAFVPRAPSTKHFTMTVLFVRRAGNTHINI